MWVYPKSRCLVCHAYTRFHRLKPLCELCEHSLPVIRTACAQCATPTAITVPRCGYCIDHVFPFEKTISCFSLQFPIRALIHAVKFQKNLSIAHLLSQLCIEQMKDKMELPEGILPVPLHPVRIRQRGFNQAMELVKPIARYFKLPILHTAKRVIDTPYQTPFSPASRKRNVRRAFTILTPLPKHVVIFDDVITTHATVSALAEACLHAGAERISVWSVARAILTA